MRKERRSEGNQLPDSLVEVLNEDQLFALPIMEQFGWMVVFIRRPPLQNIVTVLNHPDTARVSILEDDGSLNLQPDIDFR